MNNETKIIDSPKKSIRKFNINSISGILSIIIFFGIVLWIVNPNKKKPSSLHNKISEEFEDAFIPVDELIQDLKIKFPYLDFHYLDKNKINTFFKNISYTPEKLDSKTKKTKGEKKGGVKTSVGSLEGELSKVETFEDTESFSPNEKTTEQKFIEVIKQAYNIDYLITGLEDLSIPEEEESKFQNFLKLANEYGSPPTSYIKECEKNYEKKVISAFENNLEEYRDGGLLLIEGDFLLNRSSSRTYRLKHNHAVSNHLPSTEVLFNLEVEINSIEKSYKSSYKSNAGKNSPLERIFVLGRLSPFKNQRKDQKLNIEIIPYAIFKL